VVCGLGAMCRWFGALTSTLAAWLRPSRWHTWAHSGRRALPSAGWAVETNEGRPRCEAHLIMLQRYGASAAHARSSDTAPRSPTPACGAYPYRPVVTYSDSPGARSSSGSPPTSRKVTADSCPGMGEHIDVLKRSLSRFDVRVVLVAPWCYTSEAVMVDTRTTL
jgi:hypothetical protein